MGSAENYARQVMRGVDSGQLRLGIHPWALNRPGSPVYSASDTGVPLVLLVGATVSAFVWLGLVAGALTAFASVVCYAVIVGRWILNRVHARTLRLLRVDATMFQQLWSAGALSLTHVATDNCIVAPDDDYRPFVGRHMLSATTVPGD